MSGTSLPQPPTFPDHTDGFFWCWCVPTYAVVRDEEGNTTVFVTHRTPQVPLN